MDILKKLILALIGLAIIGCKANYNKGLDRAEALMNESPKTALVVLDSIKHTNMKGKAVNARFALLYSQALDKNYIDVTDDSLISVAESWYSQKGNVRERFLAHYYKGVINDNAKNYPKAITALSQAQKYEGKINDGYLLGLLYNKMGYIYENHYDYPKSLDAFFKSYNYYREAGMTKHANYTLLGIAGAYWNMAETTKDTLYDKSEYYYLKALEAGENTKYDILIELSSKYLFIQYVQREMYYKAEKMLEKYNIEAGDKTSIHCAALAKYHYSQGNLNKGNYLLQEAWKSCKGINDTTNLLYWEYNIFNSLGETKAALQSFDKSVKFQNKAVRRNLQQPVLEIQKQVLEKDLAYSTYKLETDRKIMVLGILLFCTIICIVLLVVRAWLNKKDKELEGYLYLLTDLQHTLQNLQNKFRLQNIQLSSANTNAHEMINNRLSLINNLSTVFYEKHSTPKAKEIFIKEVKNIIEDFSTNQSDLKWMETIINDSNNNLINNTYNKYPNLNEEEKRLLCYIYSGFSAKAMSVFLNIPIETVYNRKSRLLAKTGLSKQKKQRT